MDYPNLCTIGPNLIILSLFSLPALSLFLYSPPSQQPISQNHPAATVIRSAVSSMYKHVSDVGFQWLLHFMEANSTIDML